MPNRVKEPHAVQPQKQASGRWQARVTYYDPETGKRRETTKTFATEHEAKKWSREQEMAYREDPNRKPPSEEKFGPYLDRWMHEVASSQVRETTWSAYHYASLHAIRVLGDKSLRSLTPLDIQGLYSTLLTLGLKPATIRIVHNVCRQSLDDAVDYGFIPQNPVHRAKPPRVDQAVVHPPTAIQAKTFLHAANDHPWKTLWYFIALTGCRRGEALGLQWGDINWDSGTVTIQRTLAGKAARRKIHEPKTARGRRSIAASRYLLQALREHQHQRTLMKIAAGSRWSETNPWVFTTRTGKALDGDNVRRTFKKLVASVGLPPTTRIHDLRHAMATSWLAAGVPVKIVSERLGHASIAITLQLYGHVLPNMQADAAEQMDASLVPDATTLPTLYPHEL